MLRRLRQQWFLLALVSVLLAGFLLPHWFHPFAAATTLRKGIVAAVLFAMALPLDTSRLLRTLKKPQAALLAVLVNMILLPALAWLLGSVLSGPLRLGLLVTAAVPCTLASAAVWTRKAGGDDTVALAVTVVTNATCFLTTPALLYVTTGITDVSRVQAQLTEMPGRLFVLVILPMACAQLMRVVPWIRETADRRRHGLVTFTQLGILCMVLAGATFSGSQLRETEGPGWPAMLAMVGVAFALHLASLAMGWYAAQFSGFARPQQTAVMIAGSQKTLMVGLDIAISFFGGLAILPMVAYHFIQLVVDTVVADRLRREPFTDP